MWSTEEQGSRHRSVSHRVSVACHLCRISSLSHQSHLICAASHHIVSHRMSRRSAAHQRMPSPKTAPPAYLSSSCPQKQGCRQRSASHLDDIGSRQFKQRISAQRESSKPWLSLPKCRGTGFGQSPLPGLPSCRGKGLGHRPQVPLLGLPMCRSTGLGHQPHV
jgi:hypothetical protein